MLVVEIVGVLPDVDRQQRHLGRGQRRFRVRRIDDPHTAAVEYQPRPATAELIPRCRYKLLAERASTAKLIFDQLCDRALRFTAAAGAHALPIKSMVPCLGSRIE